MARARASPPQKAAARLRGVIAAKTTDEHDQERLRAAAVRTLSGGLADFNDSDMRKAIALSLRDNDDMWPNMREALAASLQYAQEDEALLQTLADSLVEQHKDDAEDHALRQALEMSLQASAAAEKQQSAAAVHAAVLHARTPAQSQAAVAGFSAANFAPAVGIGQDGLFLRPTHTITEDILSQKRIGR